MKSFLDTVTSTLAKAALVVFGLVAAGMGVAVFVLLALFGFAVGALALLASPFVSVLCRVEQEPEDATQTGAVA